MTHPSESSSPSRDGRALGWISGLGMPFLAWLLAGIVSTFTPEPETSFGYVLAGSTVVVGGWLVYGSTRIPGFKGGAVRGALVSLGVGVALWITLLLIQP